MTTTRSLPLIAIALIVAAIIAHAPVLLGGRTWDDVRYHTEIAPPRLAAADVVQAGSLPAWWEGTGFGVPLLADPGHGALAPLTWIASTPRLLDLILWLHLVWAAFGVAVWGRMRGTTTTTDPSALVPAVLVVTSGLATSIALRGSMPALAHLPWIGAAATWLAGSTLRRDRVRAAAAIAGLVGITGLGGELAALVDALVVAIAIGGRARAWRMLAIALGAGLAIAAVQWVPAVLHLVDGEAAGETVHALPMSRLLELIVPARDVSALAGEHPWAPSLFVGAPLLALAAVRTPSRRMLVTLGVLGALALIAGRGGWPRWLGAPELHLAAFVLVLAPNAGAGLDALAKRQRRALLSLAAACGFTALALAALGLLRARNSELADAVDRALVDGSLGLACMIGATVIAWRAPARMLPLALALLVVPGVGAMRSIAPTTSRTIVDERPMWAQAARAAAPKVAPPRVFRPVSLHDRPGMSDTLDDAMATFVGASAWRWGVGAARSTDPARPRAHDRAWLAAAREGGALLDRFAIALAVLPETVIIPAKLTAHGTRAGWTLASIPTAPVAAVMRGWVWAIDPDDALAHLFAPARGTNVLRGTVVLRGRGESRPTGAGPAACEVTRWDPGDIALACPLVDGYAAVTSSPAPGWSVTVDGESRTWEVTDVLRRSVRLDVGDEERAGSVPIVWTYDPPGLTAGLALGALGLVAIAALLALAMRSTPPASDRPDHTDDPASPVTS